MINLALQAAGAAIAGFVTLVVCAFAIAIVIKGICVAGGVFARCFPWLPSALGRAGGFMGPVIVAIAGIIGYAAIGAALFG